MRASLVFAAALIAALASATLPAQAASDSKPVVYSSAETDIGTLLDDPAAKAILDKYMPAFSKGDQIDLARPMTLKSVQPYAPEMVTDDALAKIDADLAKLPAKK